MKENLTTHYIWLDALRIVSIFLIVNYHIIKLSPSLLSKIVILNLWFENGATGVTALFVLSGYLITKSLLLRTRTYKEYVIERFVKIIPLYFIILICGYVYYHQFVAWPDVVIAMMLTLKMSTFGGISALGSLWFVTVIFKVYLIAPIVIFFGTYNKQIILLLIAIFICIKLTIYFLYHPSIDAFYLTFIGRVDQFIIGQYIALAAHTAPRRKLKVINIIGIICVFTLYFYIKSQPCCYVFRTVGWYSIYLSFEALAWGYIIWALAIFNTANRYNRLLRHWGETCYVVYLLHIPIMLFVQYITEKKIFIQFSLTRSLFFWTLLLCVSWLMNAMMSRYITPFLTKVMRVKSTTNE